MTLVSYLFLFYQYRVIYFYVEPGRKNRVFSHAKAQVIDYLREHDMRYPLENAPS